MQDDSIDMMKKAVFDKGFSFASKDMEIVDNSSNTNSFIDVLKNMTNDMRNVNNNRRNIEAGRPDEANQSDKQVVIVDGTCQQEKDMIEKQANQILLLVSAVNDCKKEQERFQQTKELYETTCKKSDDLRRTINVIVMIFILIMIITMLYIHKHKIIN